MITLTKKEFALMDVYAHCEMTTANGATPEVWEEVSCYLWADERADALGISRQAVGGLLTTLQAKGAISVLRPSKDDPDGGLNFTEAGFDAWKAQREAKADPASFSGEPIPLTELNKFF